MTFQFCSKNTSHLPYQSNAEYITILLSIITPLLDIAYLFKT